jgi:dihydropyrimidinase
MADFDLVIRNGTVATASEVMHCDVGIVGGVIAALGRRLGSAERDIDATGLIVLPGGIDAHCHLAQRGPMGPQHADDFESGTRSAACGGTTTIIPFANQFKGQSLRAAVEHYHTLAEGRALIDYAFHMIVSDPTETVLGQELPALIRRGYTSFKVFMTVDAFRLDDRQVLDVLATAKREGALVMVHAENHDVIAWLSERLVRAGKSAPKYHAEARPAPVEREATHRAITLSEIAETPILIVHVSAREAVEEIERARARGLTVFAETCPHYLVLSVDDLDRPGLEGAKFMCAPPMREKANQEHLWRALERGVFDLLSSDHAPFRYAGDRGKKLHGEHAPFTKVANGLPGLETRLPLLFSEGVLEGRIDLPGFVALSATNAAKIYGLYPKKGTLAVGADADIAIWDSRREVTIAKAVLHDDMDYTPYEGRQVTGWPVMTLSRGEVVWDDGKVLAKPGRGRFLPRERFQAGKSRGALCMDLEAASDANTDSFTAMPPTVERA